MLRIRRVCWAATSCSFVCLLVFKTSRLWGVATPSTGNRKDNQQQHVEPLALFFGAHDKLCMELQLLVPYASVEAAQRRGRQRCPKRTGCILHYQVQQANTTAKQKGKQKQKQKRSQNTHTHEKRVQFVARPLGRQAATAMKYLCRCVCTSVCMCVCVYACVRVRVTDRRTAGRQISNENRVQSAGN